MDQGEITNFLFTQYHPNTIWILFSSIAVGAALALFIYDRFILKGQPASSNSSNTSDA
jgi:hypothetical protein